MRYQHREFREFYEQNLLASFKKSNGVSAEKIQILVMVYTTLTLDTTNVKRIQKKRDLSLSLSLSLSFEIGWKEDEFCLNKILVMKRRLEITVSICQKRVNKVIAIA